MSCPICHKKHPGTAADILARLAGVPKRLERIAAGLSPRQAALRPEPGKWSAKEIVCHLADCELVYGFRYRKIIAEPDAVLVPFDQDAWASSLRYQELPLKPALSAFAALRNAHVSLFKMLPAEAWQRVGQHPEYGALTLKQLAGHLADHDQNHIVQLENLRSAAKPPRRATRKPKARPRSARG
jgi:hypothetical protein